MADMTAAPMIHLGNDDIVELLSMEETMKALRIGFSQMATREAAHVPRMELWSPAAQEDAYYCLGSMAGTTKHFGITAIRIKSDILHWPEGRRQEKYAVQPGTFCGFILLFSSGTGEPLALINDGILQRMRVGGSAAIAAEHLANPGPNTLGMVGSGNMARSYLEAISLVRELTAVRVYSPTQANREAFAAEMAAALGITVAAVGSPQEAVADADIVVTATNSMVPTLQPEWIPAGALVLFVTRREVSKELVARADKVMQLAEYSIGPDARVPGMEFPQSGAGGFIAGNDKERARLPWKKRAEMGHYPSLIEMLAGTVEGRTSSDETIMFINIGAQGVQFAAVAARAYEIARQHGKGAAMPKTDSSKMSVTESTENRTKEAQ